jgi:hypothetical protein
MWRGQSAHGPLVYDRDEIPVRRSDRSSLSSFSDPSARLGIGSPLQRFVRRAQDGDGNHAITQPLYSLPLPVYSYTA